jgi:2Fe-2S ferredoxin
MAQLVVTTRNGQTHTLEAGVGLSVMEVIRDNGIDELLALCGGSCACATCHVHIDPAWAGALPPMQSDEDGLLEGSSDRDETSRLGCQIRMNESLSGLRVRIAEED